MVRNENGLLTGYVYIDIAGRDPSGYVEEANHLLREKLKLPAGYAISWSGQHEAMQRVRERLKLVVPLTLLLILLLLYMNTRSLTKTFIVVLAVPFSAIGAVWFLYLLGYNMSIAVWVGLIALLGVDAETGVFMLLYLDLAYEQAKARRPSAKPGRLAGGHSSGSGQAPAAQVHDRSRGLSGTDSHHVGDRHRIRRDETDRGAHDRRDPNLIPAGTGGLSARVPDLEVELRDETQAFAIPGPT